MLVVLTVMALFCYFLLYALGMQGEGAPPDYSWLKTRNLTSFVRPGERTTLMEPARVAKATSASSSSTTSVESACAEEERLRLVAVVFSAPNNFERRRVVRESWGKGLRGLPGVRLFFLVGVAEGVAGNGETQRLLESEHRRHNDLVQEDFVDSYANLTIKTSFMLKWVTSNACSTAKFLFKTDDDSFVNPAVMWENLVRKEIERKRETILFFLTLITTFPCLNRNTLYCTLLRPSLSSPTYLRRLQSRLKRRRRRRRPRKGRKKTRRRKRRKRRRKKKRR